MKQWRIVDHLLFCRGIRRLCTRARDLYLHPAPMIQLRAVSFKLFSTDNTLNNQRVSSGDSSKVFRTSGVSYCCSVHHTNQRSDHLASSSSRGSPTCVPVVSPTVSFGNGTDTPSNSGSGIASSEIFWCSCDCDPKLYIIASTLTSLFLSQPSHKNDACVDFDMILIEKIPGGISFFTALTSLEFRAKANVL